MKRKIKVAVIDSGVDEKHPSLNGINITGNDIYSKSGIVTIGNDFRDQIGHGTAICSILAKCDNVEITMFKIYEENNLIADTECLTYALNHIKDNCNCDVIHLSLGVREYSSELDQVCTELAKMGKIIVSAFDNDMAMSFPAALDCVIGVDIHNECRRTDDFMFVENSPVNVLAKGGSHRLAWVNPSYIINQGSSFSCAYVTKFVIEELLRSSEKKNSNNTAFILQAIKNKSIRIYRNLETKPKYNLLTGGKNKKIAVLPWNKEVHSLLNFQDLTLSTHIDFYSIGAVTPTKAKANSFDEKFEAEVKSYKNINWEDIDLLVIGHVEEIDIALGKSVKRELLNMAIKKRVNVYSFDAYLYEEFFMKFKDVGLDFTIPQKSSSDLVNKSQKLYALETPVLGVFGTSVEQGKFTLQLILRKKFSALGYNIGQIGTEPTAPLFGMDDCIPFGYSSTTKMDSSSFVEMVNASLFEIDKKNVDLVIVGCQSGTVPRVYNHIEQLHLSQLHFLLGSNPDIVVLCVNLFDDLDYIRRTIGTIECLVETKVVALALSKLTHPPGWQIMRGKKIVAEDKHLQEFSETLVKTFKINTFLLGEDSEMDLLIDACISSFS